MLGLSPFTIVECNKCKRGWSLDIHEIEKLNSCREAIDEVIKCSCGNEFSYLEGIIQNLISDNVFSQWSFTSNITLHGEVEINVGITKNVELPEEIPVINKVFLTCCKGFADVEAIVQGSKSFRIISSEVPGGIKLGEKLKVAWILYGRNDLTNLPTWRKILVQAKEELINRQFSLAVLTSEMAFESFVDTIIDKLLRKAGISLEASHTILESINNIYTKVHKLLLNLDGIKFKDNRKLNKDWQGLVEMRNKIAHGEIAEVSADDAKKAFETAIRGIVYILGKTSLVA